MSNFAEEQYEKYSKFKKPSENQKQFLELHQTTNRTEEQETHYRNLVRLFKKNDEYVKAKEKIDKLAKGKKAEAKKQFDRLKAVIGGAIHNGISKDEKYKRLVIELINKGLISERDRQFVVDYLGLTSPNTPTQTTNQNNHVYNEMNNRD